MRRQCPHCRQRFNPNPRVIHRQRYCSRPGCVKASRAAAQKRWLRKNENHGHFKGLPHLLRVQDWRSAHPGYWHRRTKIGRHLVAGKLAEVVREFALQDVIDTHFSLVVGVLSHLTGSALQDEIASEIRRLIVLGHGILTPSTTAAASPKANGRKP